MLLSPKVTVKIYLAQIYLLTSQFLEIFFMALSRPNLTLTQSHQHIHFIDLFNQATALPDSIETA